MILELGTSLESAIWEGREGEFLHEIEAHTHVWNDVATAILVFPVDVYGIFLTNFYSILAVFAQIKRSLIGT